MDEFLASNKSLLPEWLNDVIDNKQRRESSPSEGNKESRLVTLRIAIQVVREFASQIQHINQFVQDCKPDAQFEIFSFLSPSCCLDDSTPSHVYSDCLVFAGPSCEFRRQHLKIPVFNLSCPVEPFCLSSDELSNNVKTFLKKTLGTTKMIILLPGGPSLQNFCDFLAQSTTATTEESIFYFSEFPKNNNKNNSENVNRLLPFRLSSSPDLCLLSSEFNSSFSTLKSLIDQSKKQNNNLNNNNNNLNNNNNNNLNNLNNNNNNLSVGLFGDILSPAAKEFILRFCLEDGVSVFDISGLSSAVDLSPYHSFMSARYSAIDKIKDPLNSFSSSNEIGLYLGAPYSPIVFELVEILKLKFRNLQKHVRIISGSSFSAHKVANFPELSSFVYFGCPFKILNVLECQRDPLQRIPSNILTPMDAAVICGLFDWNGEFYTLDSLEILSVIKSLEIQSEKIIVNENNNSTKILTLLQQPGALSILGGDTMMSYMDRSFKGVPFSTDLEIISTVQNGLSGVASAYSAELSN